jgi:branched-chain amino acid transport system ATP-binding protein
MGLAPGIIGDLFAILKRIGQEEGTSLLIAEQNAAAALAIADHGYVLQNGRIVAEGPAAELSGHPQVMGAYIGLSQDGTFLSRHAPDE